MLLLLAEALAQESPIPEPIAGSWEQVLGYALAALLLLIGGGREGWQRLRRARDGESAPSGDQTVADLRRRLSELQQAQAEAAEAAEAKRRAEREEQRRSQNQALLEVSRLTQSNNKMLKAISAELISRQDLRATTEELTVLQQLAVLLEEQQT